MSKLEFVQVEKGNAEHCEAFKAMMFPYNREIGASLPDGTPVSDVFIAKWAQSCIDIQGAHDRHLELICVGNEVIGFLCGKIDHAEHRGFIKPGYGYIMEFYIKPEHRNNGYSRAMLGRLESLFANNGATQLYLTAKDEMARYWETIGFAATGEVSPENKMRIFEKGIVIYSAARSDSKSIIPSEMTFIQVQKDNAEHYDMLLPLWRDYFREFDANSGEHRADDEVELDLKRRVGIQGT